MLLNINVTILALISIPIVYLAMAYAYLALWHSRLSLFTTIIHENGRLSFLGSLFFFDHFVACLPMITLFALLTAGAFALGNHVPAVDEGRLKFISLLLLCASVLFILVTLTLSIFTVGWQGTVAYALQRVEHDGVMTPGGNWNQLQLSNVPIGLLSIGRSALSRVPGEMP